MAAEIEKNFLCPYDKCHRIYGSDVSLNLHIKLKHNGGNKTDREKLAVLFNSLRKKYVRPKRTNCHHRHLLSIYRLAISE